MAAPAGFGKTTLMTEWAAARRGTTGELGLAWFHDLQVPRGGEATPLVANGVLYVTEPWSVVQALDARTGKPLWS